MKAVDEIAKAMGIENNKKNNSQDCFRFVDFCVYSSDEKTQADLCRDYRISMELIQRAAQELEESMQEANKKWVEQFVDVKDIPFGKE